MTLYYTPRSHFSRKVRLLADLWGLELELVDVGNVGATQMFGGNPLMKVPALKTDAGLIFDSDHICAWLARRHDPDDRLGVATRDITQLNLRAVMNGVMAAEVELLLARRSGLEIAGRPRFEKLLDTIRRGLAWLEARAQDVPAGVSYAGLHLVCVWDHLAVYGLIDLSVAGCPQLAAHVARMSALPWVARSAPV